MAQQIIQNGQTVMVAPGEGNPSCSIIFHNLIGDTSAKKNKSNTKHTLGECFTTSQNLHTVR